MPWRSGRCFFSGGGFGAPSPPAGGEPSANNSSAGWKSGDPSCGVKGIGALQVLGAGIVKDIGALQVFGAGIEASADGEAISSLVAKLRR